MEFDKLLEIVLEKNKVEGEKCLICHFPDNKKNLEKLSCSHYFHLNCLNLDKTKKSYKLVCPYCGTKVKIKKNVKAFIEENDDMGLLKYLYKELRNLGGQKIITKDFITKMYEYSSREALKFINYDIFLFKFAKTL